MQQSAIERNDLTEAAPPDERPKPWIAVDLDGTLAHYDGWLPDGGIGAPVPVMLDRVKRWLEAGQRVKIFTARVSKRLGDQDIIQRGKIRDWLQANGLPDLEVTNVKDYLCTEIWDDRAIQVEKNTGRILGNGMLLPPVSH